MHFSTAAFLGGFAAVAYAAPQGVTADISPDEPAPPGCMMSSPGNFRITTVNASSMVSPMGVASRLKSKRQMGLTLTLTDGKLMDQDGNVGYIAANFQFQFDSPPQTGAIYTDGFSYCPNNTLAIGGSAIFYSCNSGDFNNLYDRKYAEQCSPVYIEGIPTGGSSSMPSSMMSSSMMIPTASAMSDGQPIATSALSTGISQISDNQPQAMTSATSGISQISDNQPQAMPTAGGVSQISDNQPQAMTTAAPVAVTQINDNQPQAATSAARAANGTMSATMYTGGAPIATAAPMAMFAGAFFAALL